MNNVIKKLLIGLGAFASLLALIAFGVLLYTKYVEANLVRVANPDIALEKINYLTSGSNLIFTTVAKNKSNIEWLNLGVIVRVLASDGSLLRRCESIYYNYPFKSGSVDIEVVCPNMPAIMPEFTYEVKLTGEYS